MNDLISIIVPVYKAEKYLRRCIESILAQTYQNIEVLLVDDGSPDGSGAICDEYAEKDSRVRVFHKENAGVSSARNLGLREAKGEYIGFVDADDYIDKTMYDTLLNNLVKESADISVCSYYQEDDNGVFHKHWPQDDYLTISGDRQIEYLIANQYYTCSCWDRLFKKALLSGLQFDETKKVYEDLLFLYEVAKKSSSTVFTSAPLYYYCNNDGTSVARNPFDDKKMDVIKVSQYILDDISATYPSLKGTARREFVRNNLMCASLAKAAGYKNQDNIQLIQHYIRKNLLHYLFSNAAVGYKVNALLISLSWKMFIKSSR